MPIFDQVIGGYPNISAKFDSKGKVKEVSNKNGFWKWSKFGNGEHDGWLYQENPEDLGSWDKKVTYIYDDFSTVIHGTFENKILIEKYNGEVPKSFEGLEELPAVGHKTASVVMSQAFGVPAFPVDTHIHRLMYRWRFSNAKKVKQAEEDAKRFKKEYKKIKQLGKGGYGEVFLYTRRIDGVKVAIKFVNKAKAEKVSLDNFLYFLFVQGKDY